MIRKKLRCFNCNFLKQNCYIVIIKNVNIIFKVQKNTENVVSKMLKTKNCRPMLSSKCAICGSKKSRFMKEQEAKGLLSSLGMKTLLSNIPLLGSILF